MASEISRPTDGKKETSCRSRLKFCILFPPSSSWLVVIEDERRACTETTRSQRCMLSGRPEPPDSVAQLIRCVRKAIMNGKTIEYLEYAPHNAMWAMVTSSGSVWIDCGRMDSNSAYYQSLQRVLAECPHVRGLSLGSAEFECWILIHSDGKGVRTYGRLPDGLTRDIGEAINLGGGVDFVGILKNTAPYYQVVSRQGYCYGVINGERHVEGILTDTATGLEMHWDRDGGVFFKNIPESLERELRRVMSI
ncbi:hypothetical protein FOZ60_014302 [Perkinsus olseni]|uniref:Uncharacterized protein n=1 Tax=Perkinsus olseni TaxID=32597 RepID=A0A7J6N7M8_PEROL|nr:hypothetical protein FOZ60_014302 [Perkinsus olseni]